MGIRFDGDGMTKGAREGLSHLPVSRAGVDKNAAVRETVDEFL